MRSGRVIFRCMSFGVVLAALVILGDTSAYARTRVVKVKSPKTGKSATVWMRNPVYLVHGINSSNVTWGTGKGRCFLWELTSGENGLGYGLNENLFMAGANRFEDEFVPDEATRTDPEKLAKYYLDKYLNDIRGLPNNGNDSNFRNVKTIHEDLEYIMDRVPPELARAGITDYTYGDLRDQGVGVEVIAHSNGGRAVTQYTMNYEGNGYQESVKTKLWHYSSRSDYYEFITGIPAYNDSIVKVVSLGTPYSGSPVADRIKTKGRLDDLINKQTGGLLDQEQASELMQDSAYHEGYKEEATDLDGNKVVKLQHEGLKQRELNQNVEYTSIYDDRLEFEYFGFPTTEIEQNEGSDNFTGASNATYRFPGAKRMKFIRANSKKPVSHTGMWELVPSLEAFWEQVYREYKETPGVAVLRNGFSDSALRLGMVAGNEPAIVVPMTFDPLIYEHKKVLIIPSGGMQGYENSTAFKARLDEFVRQGGVIICFTQPYGWG